MVLGDIFLFLQLLVHITEDAEEWDVFHPVFYAITFLLGNNRRKDTLFLVNIQAISTFFLGNFLFFSSQSQKKPFGSGGINMNYSQIIC